MLLRINLITKKSHIYKNIWNNEEYSLQIPKSSSFKTKITSTFLLLFLRHKVEEEEEEEKAEEDAFL